ncbi:MAG: hypothetical protein H5T86_04695 [Armatimonadetes bacterium]|nr:hypothetical protein [Armatimonadota bacterium]
MGLSSIIGHKRPIAVLRRAVWEGRVPTAYLFSGPPQVGKLTTAVELAKLLNCSNPVDADNPARIDCCDTCEACRRIASGSFADVLVVQPVVRVGTGARSEATEFEGAMITTEQIAQVITRASLGPSRGRRKVLIIARAETMNPEAGSRLLKTLEEPPGDTTLILTTSNPSALLPTLVSRCQRLTFHPVPVDELIAGLREKAPQADETLIETAARLSSGRVGWALALVHSPSALQVRAELMHLLANLPREPNIACLAIGERLIELAEQWWLALNPGDEASSVLSRAADRVRRVALCGLLDLVACALRDVMVLCASAGGTVVNSDVVDMLAALAAGTTQDRARRAALAVQHVQRHVRGNANIRLAAELLVLQLMQSLRPGRAAAMRE